MKIDRTIIVEGRDDTAAVLRAVQGYTIETHGFGITKETWQLIDKADQTTGLIIFTDPDHAGEQIRKRILDRYPEAGQAWLSREDAREGDNIGIENADPEAIQKALSAYRTAEKGRTPVFAMEDLIDNGLAGGPGAAGKRERLGNALGIGTGNCRSFLGKLNQFQINREEFNEALYRIGNP